MTIIGWHKLSQSMKPRFDWNNVGVFYLEADLLLSPIYNIC